MIQWDGDVNILTDEKNVEWTNEQRQGMDNVKMQYEKITMENYGPALYHTTAQNGL